MVHELRGVEAQHRNYCGHHVHEFVEINILLPMARLRYTIRLGEDTYLVDAPASIHIPAGLAHSANVFEGSGFFIALLETASYSASMVV